MTVNQKFRGRCRDLIQGLINIKGDPHYIALGMAIGIFVGSTPFFPFHTSIALVLAVLLGGSRISAALGVWISNPITLPFFYITSYKIGALFIDVTAPLDLSKHSFPELLAMGIDITRAMILGGIVIGTVLSFIFYFITLRIVAVYRNRRVTDTP